MNESVFILISAAAVMLIFIGGLDLLTHYHILNGIKSRTAGDGQHGTAQWAGLLTRSEYHRFLETPAGVHG